MSLRNLGESLAEWTAGTVGLAIWRSQVQGCRQNMDPRSTDHPCGPPLIFEDEFC